jgi:hypothetical protein
VAPDVDEVHWMLYVVHLGKRFTASACAQIIDDLATEGIEAALYCQPLHQQFHTASWAGQRGQLPLTERIADRALALPLHATLTPDTCASSCKTLKDSVGQRRRRCRHLLNPGIPCPYDTLTDLPDQPDRRPARRHAGALPGPGDAGLCSGPARRPTRWRWPTALTAKMSVPGKIKQPADRGGAVHRELQAPQDPGQGMNEAFAPQAAPSPLHRWLAGCARP